MPRAVWMVLLSVCWVQTGYSADPPPNIIFLFGDDHRADTIGAYGNKVARTPNIDRLAREGVLFQRAYMQGGLHGATCVPSRAMLLSGRSLFRVDEKLTRDPTWPAAFTKAGYSCFMSGKWHNGPDSVKLSFSAARQVFAGGMTNPLKAPLSDLIDGKLAPSKIAAKHACEVFADEAIAFINSRKSGPFFCYVPFDAPHDPHIVPDDFPVKYDPKSIPLSANLLPQHPFNNGEMEVRDEKLLPWPRTPAAVQSMNAEYYRYVSHLDAQVGRIIDAVAKSPHARNTIIVYAADSGVALGSHGLIGKQSLYEHSVRVPLIVTGPGIPAGKRTDAMCYLFDVMPTLGKRCSVTAPTTSEGIDLNPVLADPTRSARTEMMFAYRTVQRAIRDDRWKLIRYPIVDKTQLFDLQADPEEKADLSAVAEHRDRIAIMTNRLTAQQQSFGDPAPLSIPEPKSPNWTPPPPSKKQAKKGLD